MKYIKGNLLTSNLPFIAHGCNAMGKMGAGVAKQIAHTYPYAYKAYINAKLYVGDVIFAYGNYNEPVIANCITQKYYGTYQRQVNYTAIESCFKILKEYMDKHNIHELGIPKIGAGLGGGDWVVISNIINTILENNTYDVYVYEL